MGADGFVRLPADSVGKRLRTWELDSGEHVEAIVLVDAEGNLLAGESLRSEVLSEPSLAQGASVDLDSSTISAGTTGQLLAVRISSSVPLKAEIQTVDGLSVVTRDVVFTSDTEPTAFWRSPLKAAVKQDGGASRLFRVRVTNRGLHGPADVYAVPYWDEVS